MNISVDQLPAGEALNSTHTDRRADSGTECPEPEMPGTQRLPDNNEVAAPRFDAMKSTDEVHCGPTLRVVPSGKS